MPTYEYECKSCGHRFELFQKMTDAPTKKCPNCNKEKAKRLISAGAGIIFKGSGFYETDYKKAGQAPACGAPGEKPECKSCPNANPNNK